MDTNTNTPPPAGQIPGVGSDGLLAALRASADAERAFGNLHADLLTQAADTIEMQAKAIAAVVALIGDSYGVAGLHLNGHVAPWHELREGGRYEEWLMDLDAAMPNNPDHTRDPQP